MSSAVQQIIIILEALIVDDGSAKQKLDALTAELQADEAKQVVDEGAIADLRARLDALPTSGGATDLGPLTARVQALEDRNAADDTAAGGLPPAQPPVSNVTLSPAELPAGVVGEPYTASIAAGGSTALPFSFSIMDGALPDGLSLNAGGGITGIPTTPGESAVTIQAHDANNDVGSIAYVIEVSAAAVPQPVVQEPSDMPAGAGEAASGEPGPEVTGDPSTATGDQAQA